jgi:glutathione S-transferase
MRLFDFDRAPSPRRVRIFLAEKQLEIPRINVDLYAMQQLSPEFLAINPGGTVPVLETDDGSYLTEGLAICHYIESLYPEPPLLGSGALEQARVLMWNGICEQEGQPAVAETLRNLSPGFRDHVFPGPLNIAQRPDLVERGKARMQQFFARIEQQLASHQYLAGDNFSFADITLLTTVDFARWVRVDAGRGNPALAAWHQKVSARPSSAA